MEIHQVVVTASPGDAITNAALETRALLRELGPSELFAYHIDQRLVDDVLPLQRFGRRRQPGPDDVIIFHASIGQPEVHSFLMDRPERLVVIHHNISPADPYLRYDPAFAGLLEEGRRELARLRDRATLALADSSFNADELVQLGYADVRVSPLIVDVSALLDIEPDGPTTNHLANTVEGPVVLYVGQLLPHKRPDLLVAAYHALVTWIVPDAHLVMVGSPRLPKYHRAVQLFVQELNLNRAWITGHVTDEQLVAFYRRADVYVTASEHEGFCAPLLEAMTFGLPIVARDHGAIADTMGGAGVLLPAEPDPLLMAEAMAELITNPARGESMAEARQKQLARFRPEVSKATLLEHLLEVVGS